MISIENMSLSFGEQEVFKNVTININDSKIGIIGNNGAGKSTFFKILLGEIIPDKGNVTIRGNKRIELLPQVIDDFTDELIVADYLKKGRPIEELEEKLNNVYIELEKADESEHKKLYAQMNEITNKLDYWHQYEAEAELAKIIAGMNISEEMLNKPVRELSGGQKSKIAFAKMLYSNPEYMLLDEPTNHLDATTKDFVTDYLKSYNGSILVISHDTDFLDKVIDTVLFFDIMGQSMELFKCNYSKFVKLHEEYEKALNNQVSTKQKELERLKKFVNDNQGVSGKRAKKVHDREKKIERITKTNLVTIKQQKELKMMLEPKRQSNEVPIIISNLGFKYPTTPMILKNLSLQVVRGEKILIVGKNGVGKSTLLKLIAGKLKPIEGEVRIGTRVDLGYYAQEHEILNFDKTIVDNFASFNIGQHILRAFLSNFLFTGDSVMKNVSVLSPGERSRVALAKVAIEKSNVLLLDEPTNHLDPTTQRVLAKTFSTFSGTLLVVSHNLEFVDNLGVNRMMILPQGKIQYYDREIVEYYSKVNQDT